METTLETFGKVYQSLFDIEDTDFRDKLRWTMWNKVEEITDQETRIEYKSLMIDIDCKVETFITL